jgi:PadR family transcriptional regulator, regulatory protein AphA
VSSITLTPTSYVVLGLLELTGPATPYDLKRASAASVGHLWSVPHTQLYSEPARLAAAGYLDEEREDGGRRRKVYSLTRSGRRALDEWRATTTEEMTELRDPGLLKLFFGAPPRALAAVQLAAHERQLAEYEDLHAGEGAQMPEGMRLALEAGIGHEQEWVRYWRRLARRK